MIPEASKHREPINWDHASAQADPAIWLEMKRLASEKWANVPGSEFETLRGQRPRLVSVIQSTYNITELEAHRQVQEFEDDWRS